MTSTHSHSHCAIWSIPFDHRTILLDLPIKDILSLLRTSLIHQAATIDNLYKVFPYRHLNTLLEKCTDEVREHLYLTAIQSLTLHHLDPPFAHHTQWIDLFHNLPNCTRILEPNPYWHHPDPAYFPRILERSFASDNAEQCTFHHTLPSHSITPKVHPEVPPGWRLIKGMDVSCSLEELSSAEREDQYKDILKGLIDLKPRLNEKSDRFLQNVLSYPKIQYYFLTIRDGLCTPLNLEMIVPYSLDKTSWEILEFASPYVLALDLEFEPHDHSSSQMARFDEINWEGMINLQELVLQIHRSSSSYPISSEPSTSQEYLHIYPSSPGKGLRHYTLSLIYDEPLRNLELQSIHEHEIKFVRSIARYFFNFFDPYNQPRVAVEVRSSGDEEFPSLMLDEFEQQLQVCLVDEVGRLIRENQKREEALVRFWA